MDQTILIITSLPLLNSYFKVKTLLSLKEYEAARVQNYTRVSFSIFWYLKSLTLKFSRSSNHKLQISLVTSLLLLPVQNTSLRTQNDMHHYVHYGHSPKQGHTQQQCYPNQHTGAGCSSSQRFCLWEHLGCSQILPNWPSVAVYSFSLQFCWRCQCHFLEIHFPQISHFIILRKISSSFRSAASLHMKPVESWPSGQAAFKVPLSPLPFSSSWRSLLALAAMSGISYHL